MSLFATAALRTRIATLLVLSLIVLGVVTLWRVEPRVGRLWLNTAWLAGGACLIALPLGTTAAIAIFKTDAIGRRAAAIALIGMLFVPLYLITGAWDAGFGIQGWHTLVTNPHLAHDPWLAGWRAAIWVHGLAAVPWVTLIVGAGLRTAEPEIEEDAATCASPLQVLWHVSLRSAAPALAVAALWVAIVATVEISVTDFFQVRTFAEEVYTQSILGAFDAGNDQAANNANLAAGLAPRETTAATIAPIEPLPAFSAAGLWVGLLLSTALALIAIIAARQLFVTFADAPHRPAWICRLAAWRWPTSILLWLILILVAGIPLANFLCKAGVQVTATDTGRVRSWSVAKVVERLAAAPIEFRDDLLLSARISAAAATAALVLAVPLAWSMRGATRKHRSAATKLLPTAPWLRLFFLAVCLTIPGPLLGIGLIHLLNRPVDSPLSFLAWLYDTNFAPWLVQTIRALPLATLILWPALATIPQVMLDSAATEGTSSLGQLLRIALPLRWPAVAAAWLVAFAIALGELAATVLVLPPQQATTISVRIFQLLHYGVDDRVAAICLVMVFAIAATTGIAVALLRRRLVDSR